MINLEYFYLYISDITIKMSHYDQLPSNTWKYGHIFGWWLRVWAYLYGFKKQTGRILELCSAWISVPLRTAIFIMHECRIISCLVENTKETVENFNTCNNANCKEIFLKITARFMKLRMHHAIKKSNMENSESVPGKKRNRKLLKLNHL